MINLTFRREAGSKTNYEVKFNFEYDLNLRKKISSVTFYNRDMNQKLTLPWTIFLYYTKRKPLHPFINISGLKMWFRDRDLVISNSVNFNLTLQESEVEDILREAIHSESGFSNAVEGVLKEYVANGV